MKIQFQTHKNIYIPRRICGEGGTGIVYEVIDGNGKQFALKALPPVKLPKEKIKRFKNEIGFCQKIIHENIISIVDFSLDQDVFYIMPYYSYTLRDLINKQIPKNKVIKYFMQILAGVEVAHESGVWHRDLKPENILYDEHNDKLIVADFGVAHFNENLIITTIETKPQSRLANFRYAAPEQRIQGRQVNQRTDIFALGLILNEMFTGQTLSGTGYRTIRDVSPKYSYIDEIVELMVRQDMLDRPSSTSKIKAFLIRANLSSDTNMNQLMQIKVDAYQISHMVGRDGNGRGEFSLNYEPNKSWVALFRKASKLNKFDKFGLEVNSVKFSGVHVAIPFDTNKIDGRRVVELFNNCVEDTNDQFRSQFLAKETN